MSEAGDTIWARLVGRKSRNNVSTVSAGVAGVGPLRAQTICRSHLFRDGTVVSLGYMLPHRLPHRLDFFAQRDAGRRRRPNGNSETIPVFILKGANKRVRVRRKVIQVILTSIPRGNGVGEGGAAHQGVLGDGRVG